MIVVLRHASRAKGIGLDNIRTCGEIFFVNLFNHLRLRECE